MPTDTAAASILAALERLPILDVHSHVDPHAPVAANLGDILGYHYYTELAHSAGLPKERIEVDDPKEKVANLVPTLERLDNTVQLSWFVELARTFYGWDGDRLTRENWEDLYDESERQMADPGYTRRVIETTNLERVFLTNDFDDPLEGFDADFYVPCLRTDDLVFKLHTPEVRQRLAEATGVEVGDADSLRAAVRKLFEHFTGKGARACAISLPPDFEPACPYEASGELASDVEHILRMVCGDGTTQERLAAAAIELAGGEEHVSVEHFREQADHIDQHGWGLLPDFVFWTLAEYCREFDLPFDLMIGVNRNVYPAGVHQGRDLYDSRCSLSQYANLFNAFPEVTFPVSVLAPTLNQELVSYSWIFPNVVPSGHWWYSNIPAHIAPDLRARLQAVPGDKPIGYYSDAYKLEFVLPKFAMYRRILAQELAVEFVDGRGWGVDRAVEFGTRVLRGNGERIFSR